MILDEEVIPHAIHTHKVVGYDFEGYWEDIGTIRSFYNANLALTQPSPPFNFYDVERPIYTHARFLPGSYSGGQMKDVSLVGWMFYRKGRNRVQHNRITKSD